MADRHHIKNFCKSSTVAEMGDHWATIDRAKKWGLLCPFGGAGCPSNTIWPGPRHTSVPSGILIIQLFGHNRHEPQMVACCAPFFGELVPI